MALDNNAALEALLNANCPNYPSNPTAEQSAARAAAKDNLKAFFKHITDNGEIAGITVGESYTTAVGTNGGTMNAPPYPITGNIVGVQTNDGTGRIK